MADKKKAETAHENYIAEADREKPEEVGTTPAANEQEMEAYLTEQEELAGKEHEIEGISSILQGEAPSDRLSILKTLIAREKLALAGSDKVHKDEDVLNPNWLDGAYPYKNRMSRKRYEKEKYQLQVELLKLFLEKRAISKEQYDKSFHDLSEKMGYGDSTK